MTSKATARSVPLFLSSAQTDGSVPNEGTFTQTLRPPLRIPDNARQVQVSIDSATVPFSFPNLTMDTAKVLVKIPLQTNPSTQTDVVVLTLPTGVYDLTEIAQQLNKAVNKYLHDNHFPVLYGDWTYFDFGANSVVTASDSPNFCNLLPNFHSNRVELTLNHDHSEIDFLHDTTTLDTLLGFRGVCTRSVAAQLVVDVSGYQLTAAFRTLEYGAATASWVNVTFLVPQGTYTPESFVTAVNLAYVTAVQARPDESMDYPRVTSATATGPLIQSLELEPAEEEPEGYRADFEYATFDTSNPTDPGSCLLGHYDSYNAADNTLDEENAIVAAFGNLAYGHVNMKHTRAGAWSGARSTPFIAEAAATIDKVTEIGIACPGLTHGSYGTDGDSSGSTLARFQVTPTLGRGVLSRRG